MQIVRDAMKLDILTPTMKLMSLRILDIYDKNMIPPLINQCIEKRENSSANTGIT